MTQSTKDPAGSAVAASRRRVLGAAAASLVVPAGTGVGRAAVPAAAALVRGAAPFAAPLAAVPGAARALERGAPVDWPALRLLDGSTLAADAWRDRAAVVVFWATWCPFCTRHNPHVDALSRAVAGRPMRVLGASLDRDPEPVRRHVREHGLGFPITLDAALLRERFGLVRRVTPTTVVVDRRGRFVQAIPGEMFEEDVRELARWAGDASAGEAR
ncbi:MAG: hypothetical protein RJA99_1910 [Pseudomonadota bacterium]|jgi:thiol-disulfide isomerase/thioredoxin